MQTGARVIVSISDAPENFQGPLEEIVKRLYDFPHAVFAPAMDGPGSIRKERALYQVNGTILILEQSHDSSSAELIRGFLAALAQTHRQIRFSRCFGDFV